MVTEEHTADPQAYPKAYLERIFQMYLPGDCRIWEKSRPEKFNLPIAFFLKFHDKNVSLKPVPKE